MPIGLFGKYLSINNARGKSHVEQTRYARLQKYPSHAPPYPASLRADSRNAGRAPVFCFELARARWCPCCASSFRAAGVMTGLHARSRASLPFPRRNRVRRTNWEFSDRPVNCVCASITIYRSRSMPPSTDTHVYVRGHRRLAPRLRRPFRNRPDSGPPPPPSSPSHPPDRSVCWRAWFSRRIFRSIIPSDRASATFSENFPIFRRSRDESRGEVTSHGNTEVKLPSGNLTLDLGPRYCASSGLCLARLLRSSISRAVYSDKVRSREVRWVRRPEGHLRDSEIPLDGKSAAERKYISTSKKNFVLHGNYFDSTLFDLSF